MHQTAIDPPPPRPRRRRRVLRFVLVGLVVAMIYPTATYVRALTCPGNADHPADLSAPGGLRGEGMWVPADRQGALYTTFFQPDAAHGSVLAGAAWFNQDLVGDYLDHHQVVPLRDGAASAVVHRDGRITVDQWGRDARLSADIVSVQQSLDLIVDHGQAVAGNDLTLATLATAMAQAGIVRGMQLDIHPDMVNCDIYSGRNAPHKLLPAMFSPANRYLSTDLRAFFAVTLRPRDPGSVNR